jgi:transposase
VHEDIKEDIKKRIRGVFDSGIKASDVAKFIGVSEASVSNWKKRNLPALIEGYLLCRYLNKSVEWLVTGEDEQLATIVEKNSVEYKSDNIIEKIENTLRYESEDIKIEVLGFAKGIITERQKGGTASGTKTG